MKKLVNLVAIIFCLLDIQAQCDYFFYGLSGQKLCLETYNKKRYITVDDAKDTLIVRQKLEQLGYSVSPFYEAIFAWGNVIEKYYALTETSNPNDTIAFNIEQISYEAPSFIFLGKYILILSHCFDVGLHSRADTTVLDSMTQIYGLNILGHPLFPENSPSQFVISCSQTSIENSLYMANLFYESNLFKHAEPIFLPGEVLEFSCPIRSTPDDICIYPNPANNIINIKKADELDLYNSSVEIFDMYGKCVYSQNYTDEINISVLRSGCYVLIIHRDNIIMALEKFVKF